MGSVTRTMERGNMKKGDSPGNGKGERGRGNRNREKGYKKGMIFLTPAMPGNLASGHILMLQLP